MDNPFAALGIIAERRIAEAIERGEFDNLPGMGKPLNLEDDANIPEELRMARKILKNANCLPPEIAERKEASSLADLLDHCGDERERLQAMNKLRLLMNRLQSGSRRHMALEQNDDYYARILARLERHERNNQKKS